MKGLNKLKKVRLQLMHRYLANGGEDNRFTVSWLADKSKVSESSILKIEANIRTPNVVTALRISKALDVEVSDIWSTSDYL